MIEKGIIAVLLGKMPLTDSGRIQAQANLTAKIGQAVFPQAAPQKQAFPYLIVRRSGGQHITALTGRVGAAHPKVAVDCYAASEQDARYTIEQVLRILDGYRGPAGFGTPPAGYTIQGMFADDSPDGYEPPIHGEEPGAVAAGMEFDIWHNE